MTRRKWLIFIFICASFVLGLLVLRRNLRTTFPIGKQLLLPPELSQRNSSDVDQNQNQSSSSMSLVVQETTGTTKMESSKSPNHRRRRKHIKNPIIIEYCENHRAHEMKTTIHVCKRTKIVCINVLNGTTKRGCKCRRPPPCIWSKRVSTKCPLTCGYVTTEDTECVPSGPLYVEQRTDVDWMSMCCGDRTTENMQCASHESKKFFRTTTCCKPKTEDMICATIRTKPLNELMTTKCCHTFNLTSVTMTWPTSERSIRPDPVVPHPPIWWQKEWPWPPHTGDRPSNWPFEHWPPPNWPPWRGLSTITFDPAKPTPPRPSYWPWNRPWPSFFPPAHLFPTHRPVPSVHHENRKPPYRPPFYPASLPWPPKTVFPQTDHLLPVIYRELKDPEPPESNSSAGGMFLRVIPTNKRLGEFLKKQKNVNNTNFQSKLKKLLNNSFIRNFMRALVITINSTQLTSPETTVVQHKSIQKTTITGGSSQKTPITTLKPLFRSSKTTSNPFNDKKSLVSPHDKVPNTLTKKPLTYNDKMNNFIREHHININAQHELYEKLNEILVNRYKYSRYSTRQMKQTAQTLSSQLTKKHT